MVSAQSQIFKKFRWGLREKRGRRGPSLLHINHYRVGQMCQKFESSLQWCPELHWFCSCTFELSQKISSYTDFSELHCFFLRFIIFFSQNDINSSKIASLFAKQSTKNKVAEKTIEINKSLVFGIEESSHVLWYQISLSKKLVYLVLELHCTLTT